MIVCELLFVKMLHHLLLSVHQSLSYLNTHDNHLDSIIHNSLYSFQSSSFAIRFLIHDQKSNPRIISNLILHFSTSSQVNVPSTNRLMALTLNVIFTTRLRTLWHYLSVPLDSSGLNVLSTNRLMALWHYLSVPPDNSTLNLVFTNRLRTLWHYLSVPLDSSRLKVLSTNKLKALWTRPPARLYA